MTALEILKRARSALAQPGGWTKGSFARDAEGIGDLYGDEPEAVCWCAVGALHKAWATDITGLVNLLNREVAARGEPYTSVYTFNDAQESVGPVLEVYDRTIARLEQAP